MTLTEWMAEQSVSPEQLARRIGVHWATIYKWRAGTSFPRVRQLAAIEQITNGNVTSRDFMSQRAA